MELLLGARADLSQRRNDCEGHTALHDGVRRGEPGLVSLLLRQRADPNVTNAFGEASQSLRPKVFKSDSTRGGQSEMLNHEKSLSTVST